MKRTCLLLSLLLGIAVFEAPAQLSSNSKVPPREGRASRADVLSPTDSRINEDRRQIQQTPTKFQAYSDLALALVAKSRETGDPSLYAEADTAVETAMKLAPGNIQVLKTRVVLLLARNDFVRARSEAEVLNRKMPDDVSLYGYLASADIELGNYAEAETQAQWMLNLLPNNVPGLVIGARLRQLYGDPEGALEFLNQAYRQTPASEIQELAAIGDEIARVQMDSGKIDAAGQVLGQILKLYPGYPAALEDLAKVKAAQSKYEEAEELLSERNRRWPTPQTRYALARVLARAGKTEPSNNVYREFERAARAQIDAADNANRELALYYADSKNPAGALAVLRGEINGRRDVLTLDAYAWALCANAQYEEARAQIEKALKVGIRDANLFYHAAAIAHKQGDSSAAARYFESLLQTNPWSEYASEARRFLQASGEPMAVAHHPSLPAAAPEPDAKPSAPFASTPPAALTTSAQGQPPATTLVTASFQPVPQQLLSPKQTETDRVIKWLQAKVLREPNQSRLYAQLGAAFLQKARETGDVSHFELAEKALQKSLDLLSNDLAAAAPTTALAEVFMGEHRFADALAFAQRSLSLGTGDLLPFAIVGDAYADMGEYDKARDAYEKLRGAPTNDGYVRDSRISFLKFISGDTEAAIMLMRTAIASGAAAQLPSENLAWLYYELGEYCFQNGNAADADRAYMTALTINPGNYRALAGLARVRATQGLYADAIELCEKALTIVPMPLIAAELGDLYIKAGRPQDAQKQFRLVEYIGTLGTINQGLHNRDLALFYADHDINLERAVDLANKEFEVRHDVYTWDVLAWALYKNGRKSQAAEAISNALRFNTKDALLLFHAGMIYHALGQETKAREYLSQALAINPRFHVLHADAATRQLALIAQLPAETGNKKVN